MRSSGIRREILLTLIGLERGIHNQPQNPWPVAEIRCYRSGGPPDGLFAPPYVRALISAALFAVPCAPESRKAWRHARLSKFIVGWALIAIGFSFFVAYIALRKAVSYQISYPEKDEKGAFLSHPKAGS